MKKLSSILIFILALVFAAPVVCNSEFVFSDTPIADNMPANGLVTRQFNSITFQHNPSYIIEEKDDSNLLITIDPDSTIMNVFATDVSEYDDSFKDVFKFLHYNFVLKTDGAHDIEEFNVQIAGVDAKCATLLITQGLTTLTSSVFVFDDGNWSYCFWFYTATNKYNQEFVDLIKTIQFI